MEELKELYNLDPCYEITDNDTVIVNGIEHQYQITMSLDFDDEHCCRVQIDGDYYYFG